MTPARPGHAGGLACWRSIPPSASIEVPGSWRRSGSVTLPDPRVLAMCSESRRLRYAAATVLRLTPSAPASSRSAGSVVRGASRLSRQSRRMRVGQRLVRRLARAPSTERRGQRASRDSGVHEARLARLDCMGRANIAIGSSYDPPRRFNSSSDSSSTASAAPSRSRRGSVSTRGPSSRRACRFTPASGSAG